MKNQSFVISSNSNKRELSNSISKGQQKSNFHMSPNVNTNNVNFDGKFGSAK